MNDLEKMLPEEELLTPATPESSELVEEKNEEVETRVNYHVMDKGQLLAVLREIVETERLDAHREVSLVKQLFFNLRSAEQLEEVNAFVEAGNNPQDFVSTADESENEFKALYAEFKEKRGAKLEAEEAQRQANLAKKESILAQLRAIAEDIDNINLKFPEFKQLQQDFKEVKDVPPTAETELWKNFQTIVEQFYDHLKMNKELRDLDFKKNFEIKRGLIEDARKLESAEDPVAAFRSLQEIHEEWRSVGPVAKEIREIVWDEFKTISTNINKRHQAYFEERKATETANEIGKLAICAEIEELDLEKLNSFNAWTEATEKVMDMQKRWKGFGFASKKVNNALYARFREACDKFFAGKTEYFQKTKDEFNANLELKTALCEKAEALKESADVKKAADEIVKLQTEWKKVGSVSRKHSDAIWQRFQSACNYVFEQRKKQNSSKKDEESANLAAKKAIIAKLEELPTDGDRKEVIGRVKELQAEWQEIGHVPFKQKDEVFKSYRAICDKLYGAYERQERGKRISNFKDKVKDIKAGGPKTVGQEREKLVRALENRKNDVQTIENNLGFFRVKSSAGNSMVREMESRLARLKEDICQIEEKIAILDAAE